MIRRRPAGGRTGGSTVPADAAFDTGIGEQRPDHFRPRPGAASGWLRPSASRSVDMIRKERGADIVVVATERRAGARE